MLATFTLATLWESTPFALGAQAAAGVSGATATDVDTTLSSSESLTIEVDGSAPTVRVSPLMVGSAVEYLNHQVGSLACSCKIHNHVL